MGNLRKQSGDLYPRGNSCASRSVPIQPIFIDGKSRFLKRNHVIVGKAFTLEEYYGKRLNEDMLKQIDEQIKNSLLKTAELPVK